jgi:hypothetical protein
MNGSIQSTSMMGRWTFDTDTERYIYDVSNTWYPQRLVSTLPHLTKKNIPSFPSPQPRILGRYFDDSTSVIANDTIQRIAFTYGFFGISGFRIQWKKSGLQSSHGLMKESSSTVWFRRVVKYELETNESVVSVAIGTAVYFGIRRVNRIRMVLATPVTTGSSSNGYKNRTIIVGFGTVEDAVYEAAAAEQMIAFYGRASADMIHTLGVVVTDRIATIAR